MSRGSPYDSVPVLVLGASGFIGAWTVRALHAAGARVTLVVRDRTRAAATLGSIAHDVRWHTADLTDPDAPARVIAEARPAIVFNLAGYGVDRAERAPDLMHAVNVALVSRICDAIAATDLPPWRGARFVHTGSALEYGRISGVLSEDRAVEPSTGYGRSKAEATDAVVTWAAKTAQPAVVARLFTVYGAGEHDGRLLPSLLHTARTGTPLPLTSGRQARNFTYVEDVADGLLRLGARAPLAPAAAVVNLATDRLISVRAFAETAASVLGFDPALLRFGALPDRDDEMWHGDVDVSRLRAATGWLPPTPIAEGIRRTRESCDALSS